MSIADDIRDLASLGPDFDDIIDRVKDLNNQLSQGDKVTSAQISSIRSIGKEYGSLYQNLERVIEGTAKTNQLQNKAATLAGKAAEMTAKQDDLVKKANAARNAGNTQYARDLLDQAKLLRTSAQATTDIALKYAELAARNDEINKKTQFLTGLSKITSVIPGLEKISSNFGLINQQVRKAYVESGSYTKALATGFKIIQEIIVKAFLAQLFLVNDEINKLQRSLNLSRGEALGTKLEFASIAMMSGDIAINSVRINKANAELNKQLGTAAVFSGELLTSFSKLTDVVGLSAESAGSLAQQALISGQELRTVEENALGSSYALQRSAGIALNNKEILEETGKVTGQVRINLGANPALIAEAVTKAKLLGMELNTIANASKQLLSFESSISNELEAELLTGKQLNLERARALALQGDLSGVADEIAAQNINFSEFQNMNVLQQEALAKAVGMTADGLSDALITQEAQGRTAAELRAIGKDELADRLEVLSTQQKIALFTEKATTALGNMAAVLTPVVDFVGNFFSMISSVPGQIALIAVGFIKLLPLLKAMKALSIGEAIARIFAGNAKLGPLGIVTAVAGVAALIATIGQYAKADDMAYGNNMLITKNKGAIALNNDDSIIAGTNLFGGNNSAKNDSEPSWLGKLIGGINNKKVTFDSYESAGPLAMANSYNRSENNLFD